MSFEVSLMLPPSQEGGAMVHDGMASVLLTHQYDSEC